MPTLQDMLAFLTSLATNTGRIARTTASRAYNHAAACLATIREDFTDYIVLMQALIQHAPAILDAGLSFEAYIIFTIFFLLGFLLAGVFGWLVIYSMFAVALCAFYPE